MPAINDLLVPYSAAFGSGVLDGNVQIAGGETFQMASGTRIAALPAGGHLHRAMLASKQGGFGVWWAGGRVGVLGWGVQTPPRWPSGFARW